jgi:hypothetical protein
MKSILLCRYYHNTILIYFIDDTYMYIFSDYQEARAKVRRTQERVAVRFKRSR